METYSNGRRIIRKAGRYAKAQTLQEQGYDIADGGEKICGHCGNKQRPIINTGWVCFKCNTAN